MHRLLSTKYTVKRVSDTEKVSRPVVNYFCNNSIPEVSKGLPVVRLYN